MTCEYEHLKTLSRGVQKGLLHVHILSHSLTVHVYPETVLSLSLFNLGSCYVHGYAHLHRHDKLGHQVLLRMVVPDFCGPEPSPSLSILTV